MIFLVLFINELVYFNLIKWLNLLNSFIDKMS